MGWDDARRRVLAFRRLERDEEYDVPGPAMILAALRYIRAERAHVIPPGSVYCLPDGNIMFEWRLADGVIQRLEIEGDGEGDLMETSPDCPAVFSRWSWRKGG